jgi:hypothetical protein
MANGWYKFKSRDVAIWGSKMGFKMGSKWVQYGTQYTEGRITKVWDTHLDSLIGKGSSVDLQG